MYFNLKQKKTVINQDCTNFPKIQKPSQNSVTGRVTYSKFLTEYPKMLGLTVRMQSPQQPASCTSAVCTQNCTLTKMNLFEIVYCDLFGMYCDPHYEINQGDT